MPGFPLVLVEFSSMWAIEGEDTPWGTCAMYYQNLEFAPQKTVRNPTKAPKITLVDCFI